MSRYTLRNKDKIRSYYSQKILERCTASLNKYFKKEVNPDDIKKIGSDKYNTLIINDEGHSCGVITFYIVSITFDVYKLALCEFIN